MNTSDMIDITGVDLVKFVKKVYDLSNPQGMGHLHFRPGPLSDEEAKALIDRPQLDSRIKFSLDYVRGRVCKMTVLQNDGRFYIDNTWFDHHPFQLDALLEHCGVPRPQAAAQGVAA